MIGLNAYILVNGLWVDASAILANGTGTPVDSAVANFDGRGISDTYALAFSSVVAGVSATVKVTCGSGNNPYNDQTGVAVDLDGATVYGDIVPGVDLKFSASDSFSNSWTASVTIGKPFGSFNAFPPDSGEASDPIRVKIVNSGSLSGSACKARLLPVLKRVKRTGVVFGSMHAPAEGAIEKLTSGIVSPYGLAVSSVTGVGAAKTMDLKVDGSAFNVINLTTSAASDSTPLGVVDWYRATDGPLMGMEFMLSEAAVNSDTENVLCFSHRFSQIAGDQDGVPGDWGIDDIDLTEVGQATGIITAGSAAYFWLRILVIDGGNSNSNPYVVDVAIQGTAAGGSGWED